MTSIAIRIPALVVCALNCAAANAAITVFFDASQTATLVASGVTSDTISSRGYLFTYTRDKLFTGGYGQTEPIGRQVRIPWPLGVEAQAVTMPPPGVTDYKARMTLTRVDGDVFDLTAFTAQLLANTAGAGGSIEIMPLLNGEDAFNDPVYFNASGYSGSRFAYDTSPNYLGSTALLTGYDTYKIGLYVDFALVALTLECAKVPGDFDVDGDVDQIDLDALKLCASGPAIRIAGTCTQKDLDYDGDVDQSDFGILQACWSGDQNPADSNCAN